MNGTSLQDEPRCAEPNSPQVSANLYARTIDANSIAPNRPQKVQNAITILYITLGIGILTTLLRLNMPGILSRLFTTLVVTAAMVFVIVNTGRGRNWGRMALLVLFLVGVLPHIWPLIRFFTYHPISGLLGLAQLVLQVAALVFLFQQESSDWFRADSAT
jgi:hypothetical protein